MQPTPDRPRGPPGHPANRSLSPPSRPAGAPQKYEGNPALKSVWEKTILMSMVVTGDATNKVNFKLFMAVLNWIFVKELRAFTVDHGRAMEMHYKDWPLKQGSAGHVYRGLAAAVTLMNEGNRVPQVHMLNKAERKTGRAVEAVWLSGVRLVDEWAFWQTRRMVLNGPGKWWERKSIFETEMTAANFHRIRREVQQAAAAALAESAAAPAASVQSAAAVRARSSGGSAGGGGAGGGEGGRARLASEAGLPVARGQRRMVSVTHPQSWARTLIEVTLPTPYVIKECTDESHALNFFIPYPDPRGITLRFSPRGQPDYIIVYSPAPEHLSDCNYQSDRVPLWVYEGSVSNGIIDLSSRPQVSTGPGWLRIVLKIKFSTEELPLDFNVDAEAPSSARAVPGTPATPPEEQEQ
eukprot:TRINITY_DN24324_c0_g1_i2.p1 TRINITY_DN24324_c0_g1~~TRINITY_DN24324_c0_g1_i2.p1  ORF type:complete len:480 (+),score=137.37 TRINITY_DN24324_c0_g1_i2:215-1441(+)